VQISPAAVGLLRLENLTVFTTGSCWVGGLSTANAAKLGYSTDFVFSSDEPRIPVPKCTTAQWGKLLRPVQKVKRDFQIEAQISLSFGVAGFAGIGPCRKMPPAFRRSSLVLAWLIMLSLPGRGENLRCYVCGGNSGTPCQGPDTEAEDGVLIQDPVQECNDLINNRGCVKQYVNGVVLLRGCWLDGTNKCLKNGAAEVCTCSSDLCNGTRTSRSPPFPIILLTIFSLLLHQALQAL